MLSANTLIMICKSILVSLLTVILPFSSHVKATTEVTLTSNPAPLTGEVCSGNVHFTCIALDLPTLRWYVSGSQFVVYTHSSDQQYPLTFQHSAIPSGFNVTIVSSDSGSSQDQRNFESTLDTTLTNLLDKRASSISCGSTGSSVIPISFTFRASPPSPSSTLCRVTSIEQITVTTMFEPTFTTRHGINSYVVSISPEPGLSCSSNSTHSVCSGFERGTRYLYSASGVNCGNQVGENVTFFVHPQVPSVPVFYDLVAVGRVIIAVWDPVLPPTVSDNCQFNGSISYFLTFSGTSLTNSDQTSTTISSDCYEKGCSLSLDLASVSLSFDGLEVSVQAENIFGLSNAATLNSSHIRIANTTAPSMTISPELRGGATTTPTLCTLPISVLPVAILLLLHG